VLKQLSKVFKENKMKTFSRMIVTLTVVVMLLALSMPVFASKDDDRIVSDAKKSYVFQTYLKDDRITVKSVNGAVTLTGTVDNEYSKSLAQETVASMKGVRSVDNKLEVKADAPVEKL
jgi:hyperosmotically inducible periplasmic protein